MHMKSIILMLVIAVIFIGLIAAGPIMSHVEKPKYQVLVQAKNIEIRQYAPMLIAEVVVSGERDSAIKAGFRLLANYIFGDNIAKEKIAMTAPVEQQEGEKIAMTAPVQQQSTGDAWQVSFIMPTHYTMQTIPQPLNPKIHLKQIPKKQFIVIRFSGLSSKEHITENENVLIAYIKANKISVKPSPKYAFYNPPWTLPPMRRNEIMFELTEIFEKSSAGQGRW